MVDPQTRHAPARVGDSRDVAAPRVRRLMQALTASRTNYWAAYAVDLACPVVLGYAGWHYTSTWPVPIASLCAGAFAFSFVEYAIHRWLFHSPASFMTPLHRSHHDAPVGPSALPCLTSAAVGALLWWCLVPIIGPEIACFSLCGFLGWYFCYGMLHHLEHHLRISRVPWRWLQRRWAEHAVHHHIIDTNFGVTTSLWDRVFGTYYKVRRTHKTTSSCGG